MDFFLASPTSVSEPSLSPLRPDLSWTRFRSSYPTYFFKVDFGVSFYEMDGPFGLIRFTTFRRVISRPAIDLHERARGWVSIPHASREPGGDRIE